MVPEVDRCTSFWYPSSFFCRFHDILRTLAVNPPASIPRLQARWTRCPPRSQQHPAPQKRPPSTLCPGDPPCGEEPRGPSRDGRWRSARETDQCTRPSAAPRTHSPQEKPNFMADLLQAKDLRECHQEWNLIGLDLACNKLRNIRHIGLANDLRDDLRRGLHHTVRTASRWSS